MTEAPLIAVFLASTREGRAGERVARWIHGLAAARVDLRAELLDLKDYPLPYYSHPASPKVAEKAYTDETQRCWVAAIERMDGFIIVTPEYNHGYPGALKNALDYVYTGWNRKPVAFASYGGASGGVRAVQQLRQVAVELQLAPLRDEVNIPFVFRAFADSGVPLDEFHHKRAHVMLDQLAWWARALKSARQAG